MEHKNAIKYITKKSTTKNYPEHIVPPPNFFWVGTIQEVLGETSFKSKVCCSNPKEFWGRNYMLGVVFVAFFQSESFIALFYSTGHPKHAYKL